MIVISVLIWIRIMHWLTENYAEQSDLGDFTKTESDIVYFMLL